MNKYFIKSITKPFILYDNNHPQLEKANYKFKMFYKIHQCKSAYSYLKKKKNNLNEKTNFQAVINRVTLKN